MQKRRIGILTYRNGKRFGEPLFFRHLLAEGEKLGATVFLFSPKDVFESKRQIRGFVPGPDKSWKSKMFDWPDIVIDRYRYYPKPQHQAYLAFRKRPLFTYANSRFSSKWNVHQVLNQQSSMQPWLPETFAYDKDVLSNMLQKYPLIYVKPAQGTAGRSILRIKQTSSGYDLLGRELHLNKVSHKINTRTELHRYVKEWVKTQRMGEEIFLVQQGLQLDLISGRTVDTRILIQKTEWGEWDVTGLGMRIGGVKSSTSNLHGGGLAKDAQKLLVERFGEPKATKILHNCYALAHQTAEAVESNYGRMIELGLDVGIDVSGRPYLIEINPKPGRDIFRKLKRKKVYQKAVIRPIQYALYLLKEQQITPPR
ncbi:MULTISPECIES: YheC/YheD family endospore coat-associated protein [Brevibacillus]|uniref:YheC/YheD family endospore coat-associated protein n=1 Tax=Brevibacillus TaxID=55080 RepID=UPI000B9B4761|nr:MULTISPECIES: YheC/YheD family protein [Brevibacillus]MCG7316743.1 YheC/YheD family protein [Brevibacillus laterosporus]RFB38124.1 YheC/YheD family protein [Brevibacillus sp. VP]